MKISFEEWKNTMSFMLDDNFDNQFLGNVNFLVKLLNDNAQKLSDGVFLESFLSTTSLSVAPVVKLKGLIALIGLSEERLKRVTSLVRYKFFNEHFRSELTVKQISDRIKKDSEFRQILISFFINGRNSDLGKNVPLYYMRNFRLLEPEFIVDLSEFNYVNRILNDFELQGKYSNMVGAHVESLIKTQIADLKTTHGLEVAYESQKEYPLFNKNLDIIIPTVDKPQILIESSYNITTGSGQSKRADQLVELRGILSRRNVNFKDKIILVNYCDGFGWVGRQNDLRRIYDVSDYVINQHHLHLLSDIILSHYK